jgi:hypothetical protein
MYILPRWHVNHDREKRKQRNGPRKVNDRQINFMLLSDRKPLPCYTLSVFPGSHRIVKSKLWDVVSRVCQRMQGAEFAES